MSAVLSTLLAALVTGAIGIVSQSHEDPWGSLAWALVLCSPVAWLSLKGHFGRGGWSFPTPGSLVILIWMAGLVPSAVAIAPVAFVLVPESVLIGRAVMVIWFWGMAVALGEAPADRPAKVVDATSLTVAWATLLGVQAFTGVVSNQNGMISNWAEKGDLESGSAIVVAWLIFTSVSLVMPGMAALLLTGGRRLLGAITLVSSFSALYVMSSRFWMALGALLFLITLAARGLKPTWKVLAASALGIAFVAGPATWVFRTELTSDYRTTDTSIASLAFGSAVASLTDASARDEGSRQSSDNLTVRLALSPQFFAVVDYVLDDGPNGSPSFLFGLISTIPTAAWREKNNVAAEYELEGQLQKTGRFDKMSTSARRRCSI